jgi:DNA-binding response OmpR family regulator
MIVAHPKSCSAEGGPIDSPRLRVDEPAPGEEAMSLEGRKVLIVDDNPHVGKIVTEILKETGVQSRYVSDPRTFLQVVESYRPDIILLDYVMAPQDGEALTQKLRAHEDGSLSRIPVLMMTGHGDMKHVMAAKKAGVDGIVTKPLSIRSLLERMLRILEPKDSGD